MKECAYVSGQHTKLFLRPASFLTRVLLVLFHSSSVRLLTSSVLSHSRKSLKFCSLWWSEDKRLRETCSTRRARTADWSDANAPPVQAEETSTRFQTITDYRLSVNPPDVEKTCNNTHYTRTCTIDRIHVFKLEATSTNLVKDVMFYTTCLRIRFKEACCWTPFV